MMLLRANSLARGHSGVSPQALECLLDFLNEDITPLIPEKGSVGASGDLAPLAHMALCLIGEGEVIKGGKPMESSRALAQIGKAPLSWGQRTGLPLLTARP